MIPTIKTTKRHYNRFYYIRYPEDVYHYDRRGNTVVKITRAGTPLALIGSTIDRDQGTITFAISIVHPTETFCKKTARNYVKSRIMRRPFVIDLPEHGDGPDGLTRDANGYEINRAIMMAIASDAKCDEIVEHLLQSNDGEWLDKNGQAISEQDIVDWANSILRHQGMRKLVDYWLAQPKWEEKPDLMQKIKKALAENPEIKTNTNALVSSLSEVGLLYDMCIPNEDKAVRYDTLCQLLRDSLPMKKVG